MSQLEIVASLCNEFAIKATSRRSDEICDEMRLQFVNVVRATKRLVGIYFESELMMLDAIDSGDVNDTPESIDAFSTKLVDTFTDEIMENMLSLHTASVYLLGAATSSVPHSVSAIYYTDLLAIILKLTESAELMFSLSPSISNEE